MKKIFTSITTSIILTFSLSAQDMNSATSNNESASSTSEYETPKPAEATQWKESTTTERRNFYSTRGTFDPSAEYANLYSRSATSDEYTPISERGTGKLIEGNSRAQIVYYNKAVAGTILKLTNPNNGKVTYAIVIGKLPPAESESCMIKMSEKVAKNLQLKDYASVEVAGYTPPTQ